VKTVKPNKRMEHQILVAFATLLSTFLHLSVPPYAKQKMEIHNASSIFLRNVDKLLPDYTVSHPITQYSSIMLCMD
jgi:hypothetical protein